jgi:dTDP-4-dehydrorhamnose reductase
MLGHDLKKAFKNHKLILTDIYNMDIINKNKVMDFFVKKKPELVIHTAAYTDVDGAENNKRTCFKINKTGTKNVAESAKKIKATIVYISTDYVFSGNKKRPYTETDRPRPISVYGQSKLAGEKEIKKICPKHYIIRTAWLYGKNGKNFVYTMLDLAKKLPKIEVVNDQKGSPTHTEDLAGGVKTLINKNPPFGIYHLTNSGATTWYGLAKKIFAIKKISTPLSPTDQKKFIRPAKRPYYSVLSKIKIKKIGLSPSPWQDALESFLRNIKA